MNTKLLNAWNLMRRNKRKALIPFVMMGDGGRRHTARTVTALAEAGADIIELGIPFSDPVADGPVIQESARRALARRLTWKDIFDCIKNIRKKTAIPLVIMTYINPVHRLGWSRFAKLCRMHTVQGVIIPDITVDDAEPLRAILGENSVDMIFMVAPTTPLRRVVRIVRKSKGFIYAVSVTGVTGMRRTLPRSLRDTVMRARSLGAMPVVCGFGISGPSQARAAARWADGVVVGSALICAMEQYKSPRGKIEGARRFIALLRKSLDERTR